MMESSGKIRGHITEDGELEERDKDNGQGWAGEHGLDGGAGSL